MAALERPLCSLRRAILHSSRQRAPPPPPPPPPLCVTLKALLERRRRRADAARRRTARQQVINELSRERDARCARRRRLARIEGSERENCRLRCGRGGYTTVGLAGWLAGSMLRLGCSESALTLAKCALFVALIRRADSLCARNSAALRRARTQWAHTVRRARLSTFAGRAACVAPKSSAQARFAVQQSMRLAGWLAAADDASMAPQRTRQSKPAPEPT